MKNNAWCRNSYNKDIVFPRNFLLYRYDCTIRFIVLFLKFQTLTSATCTIKNSETYFCTRYILQSILQKYWIYFRFWLWFCKHHIICFNVTTNARFIRTELRLNFKRIIIIFFSIQHTVSIVWNIFISEWQELWDEKYFFLKIQPKTDSLKILKNEKVR